jgi:D-lactate dehydrogenase
MDCVACDSSPGEGLEKMLGFRYLPLEELLKVADIITLHIPLTEETRRVLDARRLALCKQGFILINTARGALVDIDALLEGLNSGRVGGVGLDVLEEESAFRADTSRIIGAQIVQKIHAMNTPGGDSERRQERLQELQGIMRNRQLLAHENVFFTPHVGFNSVEAIERINLGTVHNIREFCEGNLREEAIVKT